MGTRTCELRRPSHPSTRNLSPTNRANSHPRIQTQVQMPTKTVYAARKAGSLTNRKAGECKPPTHADGLDRVGRLRIRCAIEISVL